MPLVRAVFLSLRFFSPTLHLMKLVLKGETPPKKNSRITNTKTGRTFPNPRYVAWHSAAVSELNYLLMTKQIESFFGKRISLTITFVHGDLRTRDSDNQLSSILDTLKDAKIITDDKWQVVPRKFIYDEYDKGNPRAEIEIEEFTEWNEMEF